MCCHGRKGGRVQKSVRYAAMAFALLTCAHSAQAHGIAGNRFFVGTLTFDGPAVADGAVLPAYSSLDHPAEGANVVDNRINWSFVRLLTPTLQVSIDSGWFHRSWPGAQASGFDTTNIGIKGEIFRNNEHEALVSADLAWGIDNRERKGSALTKPAPFSQPYLRQALR
jgi:hypothetical protein